MTSLVPIDTHLKVQALERVDDLAAYQHLVHEASQLQELSRRCWSVASATALRSAALLVRSLASALMRRNDIR